ncbi:MAG: hypothetical protein ACPG5B_10735 [Chitinophagales bacterium]
MKNISPYQIYDIEPLLLRKKFADLNEAEKAFLFTHFQSQEQISAYRQMLLKTKHSMDISNETELLPAPFLQQKLRQKVSQRQNVYRNDFFPFIISFISAFATRHQAHSGLVAAMLLIFCWFGGNFENVITYSNANEDTLAMHLVDTLHSAAYLTDNQDSSSIHFEQSFNKDALFIDSFQVNGILRK